MKIPNFKFYVECCCPFYPDLFVCLFACFYHFMEKDFSSPAMNRHNMLSMGYKETLKLSVHAILLYDKKLYI